LKELYLSFTIFISSLVLELYKKAINKVENIKNQYVESDIEVKRHIIGSIFLNNFKFENKKV
jgi:hypothetical protein